MYIRVCYVSVGELDPLREGKPLTCDDIATQGRVRKITLIIIGPYRARRKY